jgi:hypothetical protein
MHQTVRVRKPIRAVQLNVHPLSKADTELCMMLRTTAVLGLQVDSPDGSEDFLEDGHESTVQSARLVCHGLGVRHTTP